MKPRIVQESGAAVVPPDDAQAMAHKRLLTLYRNPTSRESGNAAAILVEKRFLHDYYMSEIKQYARCLGRRHRAVP